jgi:hypothetical protein
VIEKETGGETDIEKGIQPKKPLELILDRIVRIDARRAFPVILINPSMVVEGQKIAQNEMAVGNRRRGIAQQASPIFGILIGMQTKDKKE